MKKTLLTVTGMTPQVVTETLYALAVTASARVHFFPDEIHIISTQTGLHKIRATLLGKDGCLAKLCHDYDLPLIHDEKVYLHGIQDENQQILDDIRTPEDNMLAADSIMGLVRELCDDADTQLHVSLAGGRKSMGFFVGYALSLFGRKQDKLSHVLISEPYEGNPDFYYPTPYDKMIVDALGDKHNSRDAKVMLAEIPIVLLRDRIEIFSTQKSYKETVELAQKNILGSELTINTDGIFCDGEKVNLSATELAVYLAIAESKNNVFIPDNDGDELFVDCYGDLVDTFQFDEYEAEMGKLMQVGQYDFKKRFRQYLSKGRKKIKKALHINADKYLIISTGQRPNTAYTLPKSLKVTVNLTND